MKPNTLLTPLISYTITNAPPPSNSKRLAESRRHLLIKSGDVETNPGPVDAEVRKCKECQKIIRTGPNHLTFKVCGEFAYKQKKCSHSTQREIGSIDPSDWECINCRAPIAENPTPLRMQCRECKGAIRNDHRDKLSCRDCGKPFTKQ